MSAKIEVDLAKLESQEQELKTLMTSLSNRKLAINISESRGDMAQEILNTAKFLEEVSALLITMVSNTHTAVQNARLSFQKADEVSANWFGTAEG